MFASSRSTMSSMALIAMMKKTCLLMLIQRPILNLNLSQKLLGQEMDSHPPWVKHKSSKRNTHLQMRFLKLKSLSSLIGEMFQVMILQALWEIRGPVELVTLWLSQVLWNLVWDSNTEKILSSSLLNSYWTATILQKAVKVDGLISMPISQKTDIS